MTVSVDFPLPLAGYIEPSMFLCPSTLLQNLSSIGHFSDRVRLLGMGEHVTSLIHRVRVANSQIQHWHMGRGSGFLLPVPGNLWWHGLVSREAISSINISCAFADVPHCLCQVFGMWDLVDNWSMGVHAQESPICMHVCRRCLLRSIDLCHIWACKKWCSAHALLSMSASWNVWCGHPWR